FERSVFPAVGCAFVVVPQSLAGQFTIAAERSPLFAPMQTQRVLSDFITQGHIGRHAIRLRRTHGERRQFAMAALRNGRATGGDLNFGAESRVSSRGLTRIRSNLLEPTRTIP
ncbi:MAG: hypothetical protein Q7T63_00875, partial [Burkholderiaceae bacterium]|nr:hypothetical protein [Burkholderiaceae bacterium]